MEKRSASENDPEKNSGRLFDEIVDDTRSFFRVPSHELSQVVFMLSDIIFDVRCDVSLGQVLQSQSWQISERRNAIRNLPTRHNDLDAFIADQCLDAIDPIGVVAGKLVQPVNEEAEVSNVLAGPGNDLECVLYFGRGRHTWLFLSIPDFLPHIGQSLRDQEPMGVENLMQQRSCKTFKGLLVMCTKGHEDEVAQGISRVVSCSPDREKTSSSFMSREILDQSRFTAPGFTAYPVDA